jgi:hypothetical protein
MKRNTIYGLLLGPSHFFWPPVLRQPESSAKPEPVK